MRGFWMLLGRVIACLLVVALAQPSSTIGAFGHAADPSAHSDEHQSGHGHAHDHHWSDFGRGHQHGSDGPDPEHSAALLEAVDLSARSSAGPTVLDFSALPVASICEFSDDGRNEPALDCSPRHKPPPLRSRLTVLRI